MIKSLIKKVYFCFSSKSIRFGFKSIVALNTKFEGYNSIGKNSKFCGSIGLCSYMGANCSINANIGRYCSIAPFVRTVGGTHPIEFVSTHPVFYSKGRQCGLSFTDKELFLEETRGVTIKNDVWIGYGALLMDGITIGDGAIVAAGAVVTRDVEPFSVVAGVPAKIIKYRFDEAIRKKLLEGKWWERPLSEIKAHYLDYLNVENFI